MNTLPNNVAEIATSAEEIPPSNAYIRGVFETFYAHCHGPSWKELVSPSPEATEILDDFAGELLPDAALTACELAKFGDYLNDYIVGHGIRTNVLAPHGFYNESSKTHLYIASLLHDTPIINTYTQQHYRNGIPNLNRPKKPEGDLDGLLNLVSDVQFESILVQASRALVDITNIVEQAENNCGSVDRVRADAVSSAIETTYGPLCEITGFDAFASELMSKCYTLHLLLNNQAPVVQKARIELKKLGSRRHLSEFAQSAMHGLFGESMQETVISNNTKHGQYFTDGFATFSGKTVRVLTRIKNEGATAKKMARADGRLSADIIGASLIVDNVNQVAELYAYILAKIRADEHIELTNAPSREELIHIKGSDGFIEKMRSAVQTSNTIVDEEPAENGYEAVKLTLSWLDPETGIVLPVEIQITHEESRKASRIGEASHTLFKLTKLFGPEAANKLINNKDICTILEKIHERKRRLEPNVLKINGSSEQRVRHWTNHFRRLGGIAFRGMDVPAYPRSNIE